MRLLTTSLLIMMLIATIGLGWIFDGLIKQYRNDNSDQTTQDVNAVAILERLGSEMATTLDRLTPGAQQQFVKHWPGESSTLSIIDISAQPLPKELLKQVKLGQPLLLQSNDHLAYYFHLATSNQLLLLKSPLLLIAPAPSSQDYAFTLLFYSSLLLLLALWAYPLIRRLSALRKAAKNFGEGDLQQRIKPSALSYIGDIEVEFNHMARRIESLVDDVKLLSSAVSHDLRTPLARIRFGIDTLSEEDDPVLRQRYQLKISDNVDEMTSLVDTLLRYARLDQNMLELKQQPLDMTTLVENTIAHQQSETTSITLRGNGEHHLIGDKVYLTMLINNVLQNAINYGNSQVLITLTCQGRHFIMTVEDDGLGIAKEQRQAILKPFTRGNAQQKSSGHGMGLAIVKRIVDWHKGSMSIEDSSQLGGAKFIISLPRR